MNNSAKHQAKLFCDLSNKATKEYKKLLKSKGIKLKSAGCSVSSTYSDMTFNEENVHFLSINLNNPNLRKFYTELPAVEGLAFNAFGKINEEKELIELSSELNLIRDKFNKVYRNLLF